MILQIKSSVALEDLEKSATYEIWGEDKYAVEQHLWGNINPANWPISSKHVQHGLKQV